MTEREERIKAFTEEERRARPEQTHDSSRPDPHEQQSPHGRVDARYTGCPQEWQIMRPLPAWWTPVLPAVSPVLESYGAKGTPFRQADLSRLQRAPRQGILLYPRISARYGKA